MCRRSSLGRPRRDARGVVWFSIAVVNLAVEPESCVLVIDEFEVPLCDSHRIFLMPDNK